jgi:molybdopterin molybdotransferase
MTMNVHAPLPDLCSEGPGLITIDEACAKAAGYAGPISATEDVPIREAGGRTLAEEIVATLALPAFDQSAMDGYALALGGGMLPAGTRVPVETRIAAGEAAGRMSEGAAARIFTGAPLPVSADAVLMQEHGWRDGGHLVLNRMVRPGDNIRRRGEDILEGEVLLAPGERLDARHVALLASQGHRRVRVRQRARVGVISTGNELRQPGEDLNEAAIYDSNRPMIMALAEQACVDVVDGGWVRDDPFAMARALEALAASCHLIVTTGGASVGEEDHAATSMALAGARFETLRIALKPGKPAVVGQLGSCAYLGLPGNPVSALVSWLFLGGAVVAALEQRPFTRRLGCPMRSISQFQRRPGRTEFVPARIQVGQNGPSVEIVGRGGSARLRPLVLADGLAEIAPLHAPVEVGNAVLFHPFRNGFAV